MPTAPPTCCPCGGRKTNGQCDRCDRGKRQTRREHDRQRGTSTHRGYDYRWQQAREHYLAEYPLCVDCESDGIVTAATVVDHVIPHRGNQDLFSDVNNWQGLCEKHHNKKTARGE